MRARNSAMRWLKVAMRSAEKERAFCGRRGRGATRLDESPLVTRGAAVFGEAARTGMRSM